MWQERKWSLLTGELKSIHDQIVSAWKALLDDPSTNERDCLRFIRDHGAMFFQRDPETPISISELSLGSEHRIDFVTVTEGYSGGTSYKLIELESPNCKLFNKDGKTSARLSGAIDQVLEWRRWISQHRTQARKIFPSVRWHADAQPTFSYQIVIGRRAETIKVQDKIWSRIHDSNIEIVSYDRLTNLLQRPFYINHYWAGLSAEGREYLDKTALLNKASCPFTKTISDSVWRKTAAANQGQFSSHIIPPYLDHIVPEVEINKLLLDRFDLEVFGHTYDEGIPLEDF